MMPTPAIIIGSVEDFHVERILERATMDHLVIDAETLSESSVTLSLDSLVIETSHRTWTTDAKSPARGWVRRLAPDRWQEGVVGGSLKSAEQSAWLSLLGAIGRAPFVDWLTKIDDGLIAENKHFQLGAARSAGATVPRTFIATRPDVVPGVLPGERIVKALGHAHYVSSEGPRVVFTQSISDSDLTALDPDVPLVFQEHLAAKSHLRVVTVRERAWGCELPATGLPVDWRAEPSAHDRFRQIELSDRLRVMASSVAGALHLGYSSQDWINTERGLYLVDVNPGGQWSFLPPAVANEITEAIVGWLEDR
ncbi:ATP-grasp domain-containing protein [Schumannella luteola]